MIKNIIITMLILLLGTGCGNSTNPPIPPKSGKVDNPDSGKVKDDPSQSDTNTGGGVAERPSSGGTTGGGGSSSGGSGNDNSSGGGTIETKSLHNFTIYTKDKEDVNTTTGINNFHMTIQRGNTLLFDSKIQSDTFSVNVNQDSALVITSSKKLEAGDVISLEAEGYTPQQQVLDETMLQAGSMRISLKPIGSRQEFELGELSSGRVTTRFAMGASTKVNGDDVVFKTNDNAVILNIKKSQFERMATRVKRSTKADKNTKIYLDITTIDPKTELESAIGDFTYDPAKEPKESRSRAVENTESTMLESVVMTSISMTTSEGEEIHCFDGSSYDEATGECSGDGSTATLKMKIPSSQFEKYAAKYNRGDRTVPLYHYSKTKATWVRQTKEGEPVDGALVLEDANDNGVADSGDTLYISGEVGHFSYWNGDYPRERAELSGTIEIAPGSELPAGTVVVARGRDYTGRVFRVPVGNDLQFDDLGAKEDSKVEIYLEYPDGTKSKSIFVAVGEKKQTLDKKLICEYEMQKVTVTVTDTEGNPLSGAVIQGSGSSLSTDKDGHAEVEIAKNNPSKITAFYDTGSFTTRSSKFITPDDATIKLDLRSFDISGEVTFVDDAGNALDFKEGYVEIYDNEKHFFNTVNIVNGKYDLKIPFNQVRSGTQLHIDAGIFVPLYAKYITQEKTLDLSDKNIQDKEAKYNFEFTLKPFIVSGRVINPFAPKGERGIANIIVYTDSQSVQTDENGNYKMVLFYKDGGQKIRAYDPISGDVVRPQVIAIDEAEQDHDHKDLDFVIDRRSAEIDGSVINEKGVPVEGVTIYTSYGWLSTVTDSEGEFHFTIDDASMMGVEDIVLYVYDANDNSKLLATQQVDGTIKRGETLDAGEIKIDTNIAPIIKSVTWDEPIVGQPMNIYVDAYDPDNNQIKTEITFEGSVYDVVQGVATITPQESGKLTFVTTVTEIDGDLNAQSEQSLIVSENAKPVISSVNGVEKAYNMNADMVIDVTAYDPEGAALTYRARLYNDFGESLDEMLSVTDNRIVISKNIFSGNYTLMIFVSDGIDEVERSIYFRADNNVAPRDLVIEKGDKSVEGTLYVKTSDAVFSLVATAQDDNNDTMTYTWSFNEALGDVDENRLTINPAGKVGVFPISLFVTDGKAYISKEITLVIENDLSPVIESVNINPKTLIQVGDKIEDLAGNEVTTLSVVVNAYDPEATPLSYEFGEIGSTIEVKGFQEKNTTTYDISGLQAGRHAFKVSVKDEAGKVTTKRVLFDILLNKAPRIETFFVPVKAKAGDTIKLFAVAKDPEGKALSYKWRALTNDQETLRIEDANASSTTCVIPASTTGMVSVTLEVSDGRNSIKKERVVQIVQNSAPVINQMKVLPSSVKAGKTVQYSAMASDPDFDKVSYRWYFDHEEISQKSSGILEIAKETKSGSYPLTLVVSDGEKESNQTQQITVVALAAKPVVTLQAPQKHMLSGTQMEITASVNVKSKLKWSVSEGGEIYPKTAGALFGAKKAGKYIVTVIATNEDGIVSEPVSLEIEVKDVVLELTADKPVQQIGNQFVLTAKMSDEAYNIPVDAVWKVVEKPEGATAQLEVDGTTAIIVPDKEGTYKIELSFETEGVTFTKTVTIVASAKSEIDEATSVHGVVTDTNGEILQGAYVRLYNADDPALYDMTVQTDETGTYLFTDLKAGTYYLVVSGGDNYTSETEVVIIK